jgi:hypothetical protein
MHSLTQATLVFAVLGVICLSGARICRRLQARTATAVLIIGLNLTGFVSLLTAFLIALVAWKGFAKT